MTDLTKDQEDMIHDLPHHDKKCEGGSRITGRIPIDPDKFDQILINIGRKPHANTTDSKTTRKGERQDTTGDVIEAGKTKLGLG